MIIVIKMSGKASDSPGSMSRPRCRWDGKFPVSDRSRYPRPRPGDFCGFSTKILDCAWKWDVFGTAAVGEWWHQAKRKKEQRCCKMYEFRNVRGHVEVFDKAGQFLFSADNEREAREELRCD